MPKDAPLVDVSNTGASRTKGNGGPVDRNAFDYKLHPWIKAAVEKKGCRFVPSPARPRLLVWEEETETFKKVTDTNGRKFARYDVVWFSFVLSFLAKPKVWGPKLQPLEFVRVDRVENAPSYQHGAQSELSDLPTFKPLEANESESDVEEWEADALNAESVTGEPFSQLLTHLTDIRRGPGNGKRKHLDDDSDDIYVDGAMEVDKKLAGKDYKGKQRRVEGGGESDEGRECEEGSPTPWDIVEEGVSRMDIDDSASRRPPSPSVPEQAKRPIRHGKQRR